MVAGAGPVGPETLDVADFGDLVRRAGAAKEGARFSLEWCKSQARALGSGGKMEEGDGGVPGSALLAWQAAKSPCTDGNSLHSRE